MIDASSMSGASPVVKGRVAWSVKSTLAARAGIRFEVITDEQSLGRSGPRSTDTLGTSCSVLRSRTADDPTPGFAGLRFRSSRMTKYVSVRFSPRLRHRAGLSAGLDAPHGQEIAQRGREDDSFGYSYAVERRADDATGIAGPLPRRIEPSAAGDSSVLGVPQQATGELVRSRRTSTASG